LEDLQEISRGIHPAILSKGGLGPALKTLARRSSVPVVLHLGLDERLESAEWPRITCGLIGLRDRLEPLGGHMEIESLAGALRPQREVAASR
jgi:signal transduction histidine kinase